MSRPPAIPAPCSPDAGRAIGTRTGDLLAFSDIVMHPPIISVGSTGRAPWPCASVEAGAAPQLPFEGTLAVRHRPRSLRRTDLGDLGQQMARTWSRGSRFGDGMVAPRRVLALAAHMTAVTVMEAVALVGSDLASRQDLSEQGVARLVTEIGKFALYLEAVGIEMLSQVRQEHARDFIDQAVTSSAGGWTDPSVATQYLRRTALRLFYRCGHQLHLTDTDPTTYIQLPPRSARTTRPLGDDEEALGRIWSQPTLTATRHAVAWALGQATATGTEQAAVMVGHLDLPNGRVWLSGNENKREPRWGQLTAWGIDRIKRRLVVVGHDPNTPLVTDATASRNARQASVCNAIAEILTHAGLRSDPGVRPGSLPAWAGCQVFNTTGRIEEAAHALGVRSLDRAADIIGWDW